MSIVALVRYDEGDPAQVGVRKKPDSAHLLIRRRRTYTRYSPDHKLIARSSNWPKRHGVLPPRERSVDRKLRDQWNTLSGTCAMEHIPVLDREDETMARKII